MINIIWILFILIGIIYSILNGNISIVNEEIISSSKKSLDIFLNIFPNIVLWLGIMNIANDSGLLNKISNFLYPILKRIFKDIPKNHESLGYISTNIAANILGVGSASTPFGLKAIKSLQELNENKDKPSNSMTTFILINICGLTIIPTNIISLRSMYKSKNPTLIVPLLIFITLSTTIIAIILDKVFKKVKNE